ncbi:hypothetical protein IWQ62_000482 [Dispira parvispora]|uniref:Non-structural maintenance of chromosomes element 1 homolog n=1 Tax=Dispira parvispora TaxID=1520584 RepID=A0A9W8EA41_9FUNG|nr:hypothetical protein IWQ62_000482 [Dispira parvispora]
MAYTDRHRLFLQNFLVQRYMPQVAVEQLYDTIVQRTPQDNSTSAPLEEFLYAINRKLDPLSLELRRTQHQLTGDKVWALVNTRGDDIAQLATHYSAGKLTAFKKLVEAIMTAKDGNYCLGSTASLSLVQREGSSSMSKQLAQEFLGELVNDHWLVLSEGGHYTLAPRAILELQTYLKDEYPEWIQECHLCKDLVTMGLRCDYPDCNAILHVYCAQRYQSLQQNECPACRREWADRHTEFGAQALIPQRLRQSRLHHHMPTGTPDPDGSRLSSPSSSSPASSLR